MIHSVMHLMPGNTDIYIVYLWLRLLFLPTSENVQSQQQYVGIVKQECSIGVAAIAASALASAP